MSMDRPKDDFSHFPADRGGTKVMSMDRPKRAPAAHLALLAAGAVWLLLGIFQNSLWFDEAFTVGLMSYDDLFSLIRASTYDVHPHLYYILLWLFTRVFGTSIPVMRLFSVIGAVAFASLGLTHIRRDFGARIGFWFTAVTYLLGATLTYALQIRMYTWAMYFVGLAAIYAFRLACARPDSRLRRDRSRVLFVVFSLAAAYTHYFALFTVAVLNVMLLVRTVRTHAPFRGWLVPAAWQIAAYLPGAAVFLLQILTGGADWMHVTWPNIVFDLVSYHLTGEELRVFFPSDMLYRVVGVLLLSLYVLFAVLLYRRLKGPTLSASDTGHARTAVRLSVIAFFSVILFSLSVSLVREIFYIRYTMVLFVFLVFTLAYFLAVSVNDSDNGNGSGNGNAPAPAPITAEPVPGTDTVPETDTVLETDTVPEMDTVPETDTIPGTATASGSRVLRFVRTRWKQAVAVLLLAALAAYPSYVTFTTLYDPSADAVTDYFDEHIREDDLFLFDEANYFVATVRYPGNRQYFYNKDGWKVEKAYRSFGPNAFVLDSLNCDELNDYVGRVWVTRGACYEYLMSLGDCRELTSHTFSQKYHSYTFELVLLEKQPTFAPRTEGD